MKLCTHTIISTSYKQKYQIIIIIKNQRIHLDRVSNSVNIFNEIEIHLNDNEKLEVVDIFEIELKKKLIKSIRAYKR